MNIPYDEMPRVIAELEEELDDYKTRIDKAIEYIEQRLLPSHNIKTTDWDFDEVIFSDLPVEAIKPLVDILEGEDK